MQIFCFLALVAVPAGVAGTPKKMAIDTHASLIDVAARRQELQHTKSPRLLAALAKLEKCGKLEPVEAPTGLMDIPHNYLSGSHGPINPAEREATRVYSSLKSAWSWA